MGFGGVVSSKRQGGTLLRSNTKGLLVSQNWKLLRDLINPPNSSNISSRNTKDSTLKENVAKDQTPIQSAVALDCEMVGVGLYGTDNRLARVSIVDEEENVLLDCLVRPEETITDFRSNITGLDWAKLKNGISFEEACEKVRRLVEGKILVGHGLHNDFKVLEMEHPLRLVRDTSIFKELRPSATIKGLPSLRTLVWHWFHVDIHRGVHDSIEDATYCMKLYSMKKQEWEARYSSMSSINKTSRVTGDLSFFSKEVGSIETVVASYPESRKVDEESSGKLKFPVDEVSTGNHSTVDKEVEEYAVLMRKHLGMDSASKEDYSDQTFYRRKVETNGKNIVKKCNRNIPPFECTGGKVAGGEYVDQTQSLKKKKDLKRLRINGRDGKVKQDVNTKEVRKKKRVSVPNIDSDK